MSEVPIRVTIVTDHRTVDLIRCHEHECGFLTEGANGLHVVCGGHHVPFGVAMEDKICRVDLSSPSEGTQRSL